MTESLGGCLCLQKFMFFFDKSQKGCSFLIQKVSLQIYCIQNGKRLSCEKALSCEKSYLVIKNLSKEKKVI